MCELLLLSNSDNPGLPGPAAHAATETASSDRQNTSRKEESKTQPDLVPRDGSDKRIKDFLRRHALEEYLELRGITCLSRLVVDVGHPDVLHLNYWNIPEHAFLGLNLLLCHALIDIPPGPVLCARLPVFELEQHLLTGLRD